MQVISQGDFKIFYNYFEKLYYIKYAGTELRCSVFTTRLKAINFIKTFIL